MYFLGKLGKKFLKNTDRIRLNTLKRRRLFTNQTYKKKNVGSQSKGPDNHYGLAEPLLDIIDENELEEKKKQLIQNLSEVDFNKIENDTKDQHQNPKWFQERKIRLTASRFGEICKMRSYTSCKTKVHNILYKPPATSKQIIHGHDMEHKAKKKLEEIIKLNVMSSGLVIDPDIPYFAASPGNLIFS